MASNTNQQEDIIIRNEIHDCIHQTSILFELFHGIDLATTKNTTTVSDTIVDCITSSKSNSEMKKKQGDTINAVVDNCTMIMSTNDSAEKDDEVLLRRSKNDEKIRNHLFHVYMK